jgi:hypothetical protein
MDVDPLETPVALLATFLGIYKVKDNSIVQGMEQAQANRVDDWNFYRRGTCAKRSRTPSWCS